MQFENRSNVEAHRRTTAEEIARDFPDGLDYLITGVGTGGHITACAEVLKPRWPGFQVFAVEPTLSPVLSGGTHSPHPIQGIGAGFIPGVMRTDLLDGVIQVTPEDAVGIHAALRSRGGCPDRRVLGGGAGRRRPEASGHGGWRSSSHIRL